MPQKFRSFQDVLAHLDTLGLFHLDMGLGRMRRALAALGLESPPFGIVQVLGTNGKGSTAAFISSLAAAHGVRTGRYTSPHFVSPVERICVDGVPVPGVAWVGDANRIMSAAPDLTYFEFLTVLALLLFVRSGVELAVLEAGLGGRHDATTALPADLLCYTPIAMDHKDVLGSSIEAIARDKAAAIRGPAPVCAARQFPAVGEILAEAAEQRHAPCHEAAPAPPGADRHWALWGAHQLDNAGLALCAWRHLAPMLGKNAADAAAQRRGLREAFLPGRLQLVRETAGYPSMILDGAHNPHGMRALVHTLSERGIRPSAVIFSCLGDKDWISSVGILQRFVGSSVPVFVPQINNPRAADAGLVAARFNGRAGNAASARYGGDAISLSLAEIRASAAADRSRPVLVTGSLYLLSELFSLYPQLLTASQPQVHP